MKENLLSLRCVIKSAYTLWSKVLMPIIWCTVACISA